jgi:hypothetical protein
MHDLELLDRSLHWLNASMNSDFTVNLNNKLEIPPQGYGHIAGRANDKDSPAIF